MNWQEVIHQHPTIYAKILQWASDAYDGFDNVYDEGNELRFLICDSIDHVLDIRSLYDFFDEQGIRIFISPYRKLFSWEIEEGERILNITAKGFNTRTEAEEQAFLRAFQLLEDKLKEGR